VEIINEIIMQVKNTAFGLKPQREFNHVQCVCVHIHQRQVTTKM